MKNRIIYSLALCTFLFVACSDDEDPMMNMNNNNDDCSEQISYASDVVPIINTACALSGCHVAGFASGDFTTFDAVQSRASRVVARITSGSMPPSNTPGPSSLTDSQIETIECWVEQGAMNN